MLPGLNVPRASSLAGDGDSVAEDEIIDVFSHNSTSITSDYTFILCGKGKKMPEIFVPEDLHDSAHMPQAENAIDFIR